MDNESLDLLRSVAHGWKEEELHALLKRYNGNYEKAVNAVFNDENIRSTLKTTNTPEVIDLTGDDNNEEMDRALKMSLEQSGSTDVAAFGPSNRAPDANWQMTVAAPQPTVLFDEGEHALQQAIKLSMEEIPVDEDSREVPDADVPFREPSTGQPLSIHSRTSNLQYVANLIHALIQVPQVQYSLRLIANAFDQVTTTSSTDALINHTAHQDYAYVSFLMDDNIFKYSKAYPTNDLRCIRDYSKELYDEIIRDIEFHLNQLQSDPSVHSTLGSMRLLRMRIEHEGPPTLGNPEQEHIKAHTVPITYGRTDVRDDLVQLIFQILFQEGDNGTSDNTLLESPTPEIIAFELQNDGKCAEAPSYPPTLFLDRFLSENLEVVNEKVQQLREMQRKMTKLGERKQALTKFNGHDTIKDLKTTLHYYEEVAQGRDDAERRERIDKMVLKLKSTLKTLEQELTDMENEYDTLSQASQSVFDRPELQQHPYDLRAVLVSGGPPGRKTLYSYTQDAEERWWKTVDTIVTEVPQEEVYNDSNGVLLGAGPYMLLYSRRMTKDQIASFPVWPNYLTEPIHSNNKLYMAAKSQEVPGGGSVTRDVSMLDLSQV